MKPRTPNPGLSARALRALLPRTLAVLALGLQGPGCGPEDSPLPPQPPPGPAPVVSCRDLDLSDPFTGGAFHCSACSRQWQWRLDRPAAALFLLLDLSCRATTGAHLSLFDPQGAPVWRTEVRTGERGRLCVAHEPAPAGLYRLRLDAGPPHARPMAAFSGSVWINVYDHRGERLLPVEADTP